MPVNTDSELARELYETGLVAYDQLKYELARENFRSAIKADPNFFMAYFWLYFITDKESKDLANKAFEADIQLTPGEKLVKAAWKYMMDGQNEKVVEQLNKLIDLYPGDPNVHKILYILQFHYFDDTEAAIKSIERAIKDCPDYPLAYNQLGYAYMEIKQYEDAEKAFDKYIQLAPNIANPYDSKGDYFMATKEYKKAYDSYMKAYEIDPEFEVSKQKAQKALMMLEKTEG
jgi:tetratricopeptide (TPR) repeat protein